MRRTSSIRAFPLLRLFYSRFAAGIIEIVALGGAGGRELLADIAREPKRMSLRPQRLGNGQRIELMVCPPGGFVGGAVNLSVMTAAERHGEFIADFATERTRLRKAEVVRVSRLAPTQQARLCGDEFQVFLVAMPPRLADGQHAFINSAPSWAAGLAAFFRHVDCPTPLQPLRRRAARARNPQGSPAFAGMPLQGAV